jgi:tetratricopeptide (TPR) repeat protein
MTEFKNYNDWIEAYFDRRIIEVERQALEDAAEKDPLVARKIKLQREALIALDLMGKEEAEASIHEVYQALKKARAQKRSRMFRFAAGFTAVVVLGSVAIWGPWDLLENKKPEPTPIIKTVETPSAVTLVSDHLKSDPFQQAVNKLAPGSGVTDSAFAAISRQNYQPAIEELQARLKRYPRRDDSKLLLAICYLRAGEATLAARQLIPLVDKGSRFEQQAAWYLALAYFQEGMPIQAMGLMEQIANAKDHPHQAEAKAFLDKLKGGI